MALTNAFLSPSFTVHGGRASDPILISLLSAPSNTTTKTTSSLLAFGIHSFGSSVTRERNVLYQSAYDLNAVDLASLKSTGNEDNVPIPIVLIDQDSDSDATIVQLSSGDRLGALLDTMKALKDLGLAVSKGTVSTEGSVKQTKFFITQLDTGCKVEDLDMLERIRLTIINSLLKYHPESSEQLAEA